MLAIGLLWVEAEAADLPTAREEYPLPLGGALVMDVPVPWQAVFVRRDDETPPSIYFTPVAGNEFELTLSLYRPPTAGDFDQTAVRKLVEEAGRAALGLAPEQALHVRPMPGLGRQAFVFELEDQEAADDPGAYPLLVQGAVAVRDRVIVFTLLAREGSTVREELFRMLQSARFVLPRAGV